jgi:nucleotide-binding universal stress UspA family protein
MLRGNDTRLRLRREVNARRVPRWGAGVVDSLDSQRGTASCLAMVAPPPSLAARKATGQTRMLFFRHGGKTSPSPSPPGGPMAVVVIVARWRKEYHVVAAVEGHQLETPETEQHPGLKRLLETTHLELDGKLFVNTQQAPTWRANCRCFDPGGSLDRRVNCRCVSQTRWVGARWNTRGKKGNRGSCYPAPRADALAVGGYKRSRGRESLFISPSSRANTFS